MLERLIISGVLVFIAGLVALILQRRRTDAPTQSSWMVPTQLDRNDFAHPEIEWLVVTFTSATCDTCSGVKDKVAVLESAAVAVHDVEAVADKSLHERYGIDAVPTLVIVDHEGVVRASFIGPVTATDLWATMADLREPGSVPPGCDHGQP